MIEFTNIDTTLEIMQRRAEYSNSPTTLVLALKTRIVLMTVLMKYHAPMPLNTNMISNSMYITVSVPR